MAMDPAALAELASGEVILAALPGAIRSVFDAFRGSLLSVKDTFDSLVSTVRPYVAAFAPSTVERFDRAMRDTSAVVGRLFLPVMQSAVQIVRGFGDLLVPATRLLAPALRDLTGAFMTFFDKMSGVWSAQLGVVIDAFRSLWEGLKAGAPVWEGLLEAWRAIAAISTGLFSAWVEVVKAVWSSVAGFLGLRDRYASLGAALKDLSKQAIIAAAVIAKTLGADSFLAGLRRAFEPPARGASVGAAAAQNAQLTTGIDWARNLALAAATASGAAGQTPEDQFREEVKAALKAIDTIDVKEALKAEIEDTKKALVEELKKLPAEIAKAVAAGTARTLRPPPPLPPVPRMPWG